MVKKKKLEGEFVVIVKSGFYNLTFLGDTMIQPARLKASHFPVGKSCRDEE